MTRKTKAIPDDGYLPRIADGQLAELMKSSGAVQIKGPKWCGKTATATRATASQVYMQDPDNAGQLASLAETKPSLILRGAEPRLIDEWQDYPQLWDAVRFAVDQGRGKGRFILAGSSTPKGTKPMHSGVGRIARLYMRTMSLYETGESAGGVSLADLFAGNLDIGALIDFDIEDIAYALCRGGWPEAIAGENDAAVLRTASNYVTEFLDTNLSEMDGVSRNRNWMHAIMRSYARNMSTEAPNTTIAADMQSEPPSLVTVADYLDALARACFTEDLEAWNPRLRSKTAVRTSPTRHLTDPSLAAALLGVTPESLLGDFATFELLFESLCVHDLRVYMEALGGSVYHYRDKTGLEADAVLVLPDGRWAPVEVKLGGKQIDNASKHLRKLAERVDQERMGAPSFLMVVTGTAAAYMRDDGVMVAPLATLAP